MRTMLTMLNVVQIIISDIAHTVYITFTVFWNFSKLLFVLHILVSRSFYSEDAHHGNYGERCSNHNFRRWAQNAYHIYSVLKIIEITVCFAHFGFYEISTPVIRTMLTIGNVVQIIISDIAHIVFITFKVFWNFSKLLLVLHILAFPKFLLRWYQPRYVWET